MKILIIDDEVSICAVLKAVLREKGFDVCTASDGETADRLIEMGQFDIALLDINMPWISGIVLLEQIKKRFPEKKVVMITGNCVNKGLVAELRRKGAENCLQKPFAIAALVSEIRKCLCIPEKLDTETLLHHWNT